MISGALSSSNLFNRLLRLMTRRYKSLRSEVAKRPPSNCTIGRSSGGITGTTSKIIHSGRLPDLRKASQTSKRRTARIFLCPLTSFNSARSSAVNADKSISSSSALIAVAPIPTLKPLPYLSRASIYSPSLNNCFFTKGVSPASSTM